MQSSIISVRWFRSWIFTAAALIVLVTRAVTAGAASVNLYFDRAVAPVEFAAQEIVTAFRGRERPVDLHDLGKLEDSGGTRIVLTDLSDPSTLKSFEGNRPARHES